MTDKLAKADKRLTARRNAFKALPSGPKFKGYKRPGSMNKKKGS